MTMDITDLLMNRAAKCKFVYFSGDDGELLLSKSTVPPNEVKRALDACGGLKLTGTTAWEERENEKVFTLYLAKEKPSPQLDAKILKTIKKQTGKSIAVRTAAGDPNAPEATPDNPARTETTVPQTPADPAALLREKLQQLMPDYQRAQASPIAGQKLRELVAKVGKHLDAKDLKKAATDLANLETLIQLALKHATSGGTPTTAPQGSGSQETAPQPDTPKHTGARDDQALRERLSGPFAEKLGLVRKAGTRYQAEILRLSKLVGESGKKGEFAQGHDALDELERLVALAAAEMGRKAEFEEFAAEVRKQKNTARAQRLGEALAGVKSEKYFPPGMADQYAKEGLKPGKEFQLFLTALRNFEAKYKNWRDAAAKGSSSPVDFTPWLHDLDEMVGVTQAYLTHYAQDLSDREKKSPESLRKKQIAETTLRMLQQTRIKAEFEGLGDPAGWDLKKQNQAAALYSKVLFEEGDAPASKLGSGQSGVSGAWWVEALDFTDPQLKDRKKKFIFKPSDAEEPIPGFPKGGSAPREVVSKVVSDRLQSLTGLDFGVPETTLVSIDDSKLADPERAPDTVMPAQRMGSMQHFSKTDGQLADLREKNPGMLARVPKEDVQKLAILDLVTLNTDRHSGNFLIKDGSGDANDPNAPPPRLVPIDHGLTIPSRQGMDARRLRLGANALTSLPASREKFTPEMLEAIERIDADTVVQGMKDSVKVLAELHPGQGIEKMVPDANLELTRRSIAFLKKAAPELSVDELFDAYALDAEAIFDSPPEQQAEAFARAVSAAKARSAARREVGDILGKAKEQKKQRADAVEKLRKRGVPQPEWRAAEKKPTDAERLVSTLQDLGWMVDMNNEGMENWCRTNPRQAMNIFKHRLENPALRRAVDAALEQVAPPEPLAKKIRHLSLKAAHAEAMAELKKQGRAAPEAKQPDPPPQEVARAMGEIEAEGMGVPKWADDPKKELALQTAAAATWFEYQRQGGTHELCRLGGSAENPNLSGRLADLQTLKATAAQFEQIDQLDAEALQAQFERSFTRRLEAVLDSLQNLEPSSEAARALRMRYRDLLPLADEKRFDELDPLLGALEQDAGAAATG